MPCFDKIACFLLLNEDAFSSISGNQIDCKEADNATDADVVTYDEYDFDKDSETDVTALAHYAKDIFEYLIACEVCFDAIFII